MEVNSGSDDGQSDVLRRERGQLFFHFLEDFGTSSRFGARVFREKSKTFHFVRSGIAVDDRFFRTENTLRPFLKDTTTRKNSASGIHRSPLEFSDHEIILLQGNVGSIKKNVERFFLFQTVRFHSLRFVYTRLVVADVKRVFHVEKRIRRHCEM